MTNATRVLHVTPERIAVDLEDDEACDGDVRRAFVAACHGLFNDTIAPAADPRHPETICDTFSNAAQSGDNVHVESDGLLLFNIIDGTGQAWQFEGHPTATTSTD